MHCWRVATGKSVWTVHKLNTNGLIVRPCLRFVVMVAVAVVVAVVVVVVAVTVAYVASVAVTVAVIWAAMGECDWL